MEKKYVDFCKAMEDAKLFRKGSHKNATVIESIKGCCEMTDEELEKYKGNQTVMMIHDEYTDWLETYVG